MSTTSNHHPPRTGIAIRALVCLMTGMAVLCMAGCSRLQVQHEAASPSRMHLDGLELANRRADTTAEVISMLGLDRACRDDRMDCARKILATEGSIREGTRLIAAADVLHRTARRSSGTTRHAAWLACAQHTYRYLHAAGLAGRQPAITARSQLALRLHNACTAGVAQDVIAAKGAGGLEWAVNRTDFPVSAVSRIDLAREVTVRGLRTRQVDDGIGVAAVASGRTGNWAGTFPAQSFALAITIRFEPGANNQPRLIATDASRRQSVSTAFGEVDLARDMSAAYAVAAAAFEREGDRWGGLFDADQDRDDSQIQLLAPIDPHKTPVILVHGLASSPVTWANMVNELLGDPDISEHYQFWLARYSTALPVLINRQRLAGTLDNLRTRIASQSGPLPPAILVGHSMGGVIVRMMVTDPGTSLWSAAFTTAPGPPAAGNDDLAKARQLFLYPPVANVDEVVFIAAPHGGSAMAEGWFAGIVRQFIHLPATTLGYLSRLANHHPDIIQPSLRDNFREGGPSSLTTLSPTQPVMQVARTLPVLPGIRIHSIIGIHDRNHPERGDGVVPLASASWPAGSTDLIDGGHNLQTRPATIAVLKRILLERLGR